MSENTLWRKKDGQTGAVGTALTAGRSTGGVTGGVVQLLWRGDISCQKRTVSTVLKI